MLQGPLMEAPANRLVMLTDYVDPEERRSRVQTRMSSTVLAPSHSIFRRW